MMTNKIIKKLIAATKKCDDGFTLKFNSSSLLQKSSAVWLSTYSAFLVKVWKERTSNIDSLCNYIYLEHSRFYLCFKAFFGVPIIFNFGTLKKIVPMFEVWNN